MGDSWRHRTALYFWLVVLYVASCTGGMHREWKSRFQRKRYRKPSESVFAYTVSYNHDTRQPNWVAWSLTRAHASGKLKRGDFEDDMDMPSPKGTKADYYNSGYDRGHLCPAGDNKWNQKAMDECFLMTNMCPQTHALNAGIWNSIEQQCRTWAKKYGKVYIVCGPIFPNKQHRKLGKNKVVVPRCFLQGYPPHRQESASHRLYLSQSGRYRFAEEGLCQLGR